MISLRTITGKVFDLHDSFLIAFERINPFLSESGSYSFPAKIPATRKNIAIINYPSILDAAHRYSYSERVILEAEHTQLAGYFIFDSIDDGYINFHIESDEGGFYSSLKEIQMPDLDWGGPVYPKYFDPNLNQNIILWDEALKDQWTNDLIYPQSDWAIYPVALRASDSEIVMINRLCNNLGIDSTCAINISALVKDSISFIVRLQDGASVNNLLTISGRGVSPFLYLPFVINQMFKSLHFTITKNDLEQIPDYNRITLLNNVVDIFNFHYDYNLFSNTPFVNINDVLVKDHPIYYKHLLPTVSVFDFIKCIENAFSVTIRIDFISNEVQIISNDETFDTPVQFDLTKYITKPPSIVYEKAEKTILKVVPDVSADHAGTQGDSFPDFIKSYKGLTLYEGFNQIPTSGRNINKLFYAKRNFGFYRQLSNEDNNITGVERVSSLQFSNLDKTIEDENVQIKEIKPICKMLSNIPIFQPIKVNVSGSGLIINKGYLNMLFAPLLGMGARRVNNKISALSSEYTDKTDIAFSVFRGKRIVELTMSTDSDMNHPYYEQNIPVPWGTTYTSESNGLQFMFTPPQDYAPGFSLYNLWKKTAENIEKSYTPITCHFKLPVSILSKLTQFKRVRLFANDYIIESWSEEYSKRGVKTGEFKLRRVTPYSDEKGKEISSVISAQGKMDSLSSLISAQEKTDSLSSPFLSENESVL